MGRRSVCDPVDAASIVERITKGETTAGDAWRAYAATAVHPCARATFAGALSRARISAGRPIAVNAMRNLKRGVSGHEIRKRAGAPDRSRAQAGPVLVIGPDAALRVRGGALDVEHGSGKDRVHVRIDVDEPKPAAILFDAHGEFLTGEAIRWCARYSSVAGVATGLKLIGPDRGNYRDWVLEGVFEMTHAATGEKTRATRTFNRDRKFFISVKDLLKTGKKVEFGYVFYVERLAASGGLKERLEIIFLEGCENSSP